MRRFILTARLVRDDIEILACKVKVAPWILLALGGGLIFSVAVMLADSKHYEHSAQKQQQTTVKASNERKAG